MSFIFIPCFHNCQFWVIFRLKAHFQKFTHLTYNSFQTEHNSILFVPPLVLFTKVIRVFFTLNKIIDSHCLNRFWSPFPNHLRVIFPRYSWSFCSESREGTTLLHHSLNESHWVTQAESSRQSSSNPVLFNQKCFWIDRLEWRGKNFTTSGTFLFFLFPSFLNFGHRALNEHMLYVSHC